MGSAPVVQVGVAQYKLACRRLAGAWPMGQFKYNLLDQKRVYVMAPIASSDAGHLSLGRQGSSPSLGVNSWLFTFWRGSLNRGMRRAPGLLGCSRLPSMNVYALYLQGRFPVR